jgi:hypothetical protein
MVGRARRSTGTTDERYYRTTIPKAYRIYAEYLKETWDAIDPEKEDA